MVLFVLAGIFIAWEDTVEGVAVRDYVDEDIAGTAYGILGVVNGIGDFASSLIVDLLWTCVGASWSFTYAAVVGLAGTVCMSLIPTARSQSGSLKVCLSRDDPLKKILDISKEPC